MKKNMDSNLPALQNDKPSVLVVEDEEDVRQTITDTLSIGGFSCVSPAASVGEAITALKNDGIKLMVLDWELDRCGSEVLTEAKRLYPHLPVLVLSGLPCTDAIMEDADVFLPKPFSAAVLIEHATQLVERDTFLPKRPEDILPLEEVKRIYIQHVVSLLNNNASLAAEKLEIHRQTVSAALERAESDRGDHCGRGFQSRQERLSTGDVGKRNNAWVGEDVGLHTT
jgi:DNA-binding NtrC family response regulator